MIRELDSVVLCRDLSEYDLKKGDIGVVVHRYKNGNVYEVEFVTGEGKTVAVVTLTNDDIRLMQAQEILHARELASA